VLLKMGTYGFLRFSMTMFPDATRDLAPLLLVLATIGVVYGALMATVQADLKRLIAYSSVAHLGFVVLGTFALTTQGMAGGVFTMIAHGLNTSALFLLVGMLYERRHTREISQLRGIWKVAPRLGALFLVAAFASVGLPGLSGFVGEFLSLVGTFLVNPVAAAVATFCMILVAGYLLYMYGRIIFGEVSEFIVGLGGHVTDMTPTEILTLVPLATLIVVFGVQPGLLLELVQGSVVDTMGAIRDGAPIAIGPEVVVIALGAIIVLVAARTFVVATAGRPERAVVAEGGGAH
jgi:NADH-quinone oxidoreductase subunit M